MQGSVKVASDAVAVAYFANDCKSAFDCDELQADLRHRVRELFPSFQDSNHYLEKDVYGIAENELAYVAISKNGRLFSLSLVPKLKCEDWSNMAQNIGQDWCKQNADKFRLAFATLRKVKIVANSEYIFKEISQ